VDKRKETVAVEGNELKMLVRQEKKLVIGAPTEPEKPKKRPPLRTTEKGINEE